MVKTKQKLTANSRQIKRRESEHNTVKNYYSTKVLTQQGRKKKNNGTTKQKTMK